MIIIIIIRGGGGGDNYVEYSVIYSFFFHFYLHFFKLYLNHCISKLVRVVARLLILNYDDVAQIIFSRKKKCSIASSIFFKKIIFDSDRLS
jgi:hypothetical protein